MDENLDSFLDTNKNFKYNENKTRVICLLTNHELACNVSALKSYMTGKKYQQLTRHGDIDFGKIEQYKQYLIPSRKGKQKLYCKITKKEINNIPYQIERHVIGRKFQRDLKLYLQTANGAENKKDEQHNDNDEEMKDATEEGNKSGDDLSEDLDENDKSMCEDDDAENGSFLKKGDGHSPKVLELYTPIVCLECCKPITDQYMLRINNESWHPSCLKCTVCKQELATEHLCYMKERKVICKEDYTRQFKLKYSVKCSCCQRAIQETDWVRKAKQHVYHLACFACDVCKRQLSTGEEFALVEHTLLCKLHYIEKLESPLTPGSNHAAPLILNSPSNESDLSSQSSNVKEPMLMEDEEDKAKRKANEKFGIGRSKRVRTSFTDDQLQILQANFEIDPNPDAAELERVSRLTGLSKRVTQVWFQNSRARQKKQGNYGRMMVSSPQACDGALGMESGKISASQLTASGTHGSYGANYSRYNGKSAWCSIIGSSPGEFREKDHYLQIDLLHDFKITAMAFQGLSSGYSFGPLFKLLYKLSATGEQFQAVKDINGSSLLSTTNTITFQPTLCARYLKYLPFVNENQKCVKLELYGCDKCIPSTSTSTRVIPGLTTVATTTASSTMAPSKPTKGAPLTGPPAKEPMSLLKIIVIVLVILVIFLIILVVALRYRVKIRSWCRKRKNQSYRNPKIEKQASAKKNLLHVTYDATDSKQEKVSIGASEESINHTYNYSEVYAAPIISHSAGNNSSKSLSHSKESFDHVYDDTRMHKSAGLEQNPIYEGSQIYEDPYRLVTGSILYTDTMGLEDKKQLNVREFPRNKLVFKEQIGQGQFGEVYICEVDGLLDIIEDEKRYSCMNTAGVSRVAVKMLKSGTEESVEQEFMKEVRIMSKLAHKNVVQLIGVCYGEPKCMVVEYMEEGDLMQFLQRYHRYDGLPSEQPLPSEVPDDILLNDTLLYIATQIADGMNYLSTQGFVHRDLATRNCLVGNSFTVKIADFGMSRCLYSKQYYRIEGKAVLPIRWMAPESLYYGTFTSQSDVWAFAVTVWEIFMFVTQPPYDYLSDKQVIDNACIYMENKAKAFKYLHQPAGCPDDIYSMLLRCWQKSPETRPEFSDLLEFFKSQHTAWVEVTI
eukprot:gene15813-17408_t